MNTTGIIWRVERSTELVATVQPKDEQVTNTRRMGTLVATPSHAADADDSLATDLAATTWGVQIDAEESDAMTFALRPLARRPRWADALQMSASIEDLNLLATTENALKRLGVITLGDALRTQAEDVLALPRYPLRTLFDLAEQLHGLRIP